MSKSIKITRFCHIEARGALDAHFGSEKQKSHLCSLFGAENAVLRPVAYKLEGRRAERRAKAAKPGPGPAPKVGGICGWGGPFFGAGWARRHAGAARGCHSPGRTF